MAGNEGADHLMLGVVPLLELLEAVARRGAGWRVGELLGHAIMGLDVPPVRLRIFLDEGILPHPRIASVLYLWHVLCCVLLLVLAVPLLPTAVPLAALLFVFLAAASASAAAAAAATASVVCLLPARSKQLCRSGLVVLLVIFHVLLIVGPLARSLLVVPLVVTAVLVSELLVTCPLLRVVLATHVLVVITREMAHVLPVVRGLAAACRVLLVVRSVVAHELALVVSTAAAVHSDLLPGRVLAHHGRHKQGWEQPEDLRSTRHVCSITRGPGPV
mmetsp:Transcript_134211/g.347598  ORF Transcript_134211/g.347598 Transcript_134211/m.347598 type:complete len:274 (+) Transcript_134211:568-1389(+)